MVNDAIESSADPDANYDKVIRPGRKAQQGRTGSAGARAHLGQGPAPAPRVNDTIESLDGARARSTGSAPVPQG